MKTARKLLLVLVCVACAGCASGLWRRTETVSEAITAVPTVTNTVIFVTNTVQTIDHQVVTNWITNLVAVISPGYSFTNLLTNIVFSPAPAATNTINLLRQVNDFANPTPLRPLLDVGLAAAAGLLGLVARLKSNKAALVPTLITGIEQAANPEVKAKIQQLARAVGVEERLHDEVKKLT